MTANRTSSASKVEFNFRGGTCYGAADSFGRRRGERCAIPSECLQEGGHHKSGADCAEWPGGIGLFAGAWPIFRSHSVSLPMPRPAGFELPYVMGLDVLRNIRTDSEFSGIV